MGGGAQQCTGLRGTAGSENRTGNVGADHGGIRELDLHSRARGGGAWQEKRIRQGRD